MAFPELRWGTHGTHAVLVSVTAAAAAHACTHACSDTLAPMLQDRRVQRGGEIWVEAF